jgi:hypothetical protein
MKRCSSGKSSLMGEVLAYEGKDVMISSRTIYFFLLGVENSRLYS